MKMLSASGPYILTPCYAATPPNALSKFAMARISLLGGSWGLVSRIRSTLIGVISNYSCSYLTYNPTY